jgi:hypothetical protein
MRLVALPSAQQGAGGLVGVENLSGRGEAHDRVGILAGELRDILQFRLGFLLLGDVGEQAGELSRAGGENVAPQPATG